MPRVMLPIPSKMPGKMAVQPMIAKMPAIRENRANLSLPAGVVPGVLCCS